jgi:hypothetical protein
MTTKILFRASLAEEPELLAAAKHFPVLDSRVKASPGDFIIPRYSVVPFAKEFFDDMNYVGAKTINSYQQFRYIADLKNYTNDLGDLTPRTWLASEGIFNLPENKSFVLKGETNSKKFEWQEMMFAENKQRVSEIQGKLLKDGIIGDQEIYIREYIPLKTFAISFKGLPITNEYRFFICNKQVVSSGYYWSNYYNDLTAEGHDLRSEQVPSSFIQKVIDKVGSNSNAFVIDVGETKEGEWIVIELNAFEQSGLSENNPDILYSNLKTILK